MEKDSRQGQRQIIAAFSLLPKLQPQNSYKKTIKSIV